MKTRSGVAIAYSEFADARLNLTALVNTAFSMLLGDYIFIHSHCPINSPASPTFQATKGGQVRSHPLMSLLRLTLAQSVKSRADNYVEEF